MKRRERSSNDYTAAPVYFSDSGNGAHEWLVEFEKEPADKEQFVNELDKALQNINSDYEAKRHKDIALGKPILHALNKGVFTSWLKSKGSWGDSTRSRVSPTTAPISKRSGR